VKAAALTLAFVSLAAQWARADAEADRLFTEKVKPLLELRCVGCHGTEKQKGGLRLDARDALLKGGDTGPALALEKPEESLLLASVNHATKELAMPPKEKLTPAEIALLTRWVKAGAPWPKDTALTARPPLQPGERLGDAWTDPRNPIVRIFGGERLDLWSVRPLRTVTPPAGPHPIDALTAHPAAGSVDPRALLRRLTFDLTGLPPSADEVAAFQKAAATDLPTAIAAAADRLLASPRYGEHWGRQWLDVIRYSDSNGFDWDEFRPKAWQFRDYVIRAFNSDKPFDRFILEQLAGDELLAGPPKDAAEQDTLIATGFLRLGPTDNAAQLFNEQDRARNEWMIDLTETTGSAFLGLTFSCCRCHDHKTDPLSQADHFRLRAFFEPIRQTTDLPLDLAPEQEAIRRANGEVDAKVKALQKESTALIAVVKERLLAERRAKLDDTQRRLLDTPKAERTAETEAAIKALEKKLTPADKTVKAALTADETKRQEELKAAIEAAQKTRRSFAQGLLASDQEDRPAVTHILYQGDHKSPREEVVAGFPSILDPNPAAIEHGPNAKTTGRRLTLARWITSPKNPLTARVLVNRVWQSYFGEGLVATPNDFGFAGAKPSQPELLDWLAAEFMRDGWSIKRLHKLIVTSAAYRAPHTPRRLSAEQLRDAMLATSGLLTQRPGGPPIWPELPPEVLQANPAFLDDNPEKTKGWYPSPKDQQFVRSVYLVQKRTVRVPFMETFDLPENSVSCARRVNSTVAPQALSLLNSTLALDAARAFATRLEKHPDPATQIREAFALAFQRAPSDAEAAACLRLRSECSLAEMCRALLNTNEFLYLE
jgi:mono/diheme cytochrome c family protein